MKLSSILLPKLCFLTIVGFSLGACTVLKPSSPTVNSPLTACGIEQCHGLNITCGQNVPEVCTTIYQLGDFCHQYVNCRVENGSCQMVDTTKFDQCKSCVEQCQKLANQEAFGCEEQCRVQLGQK